MSRYPYGPMVSCGMVHAELGGSNGVLWLRQVHIGQLANLLQGCEADQRGGRPNPATISKMAQHGKSERPKAPKAKGDQRWVLRLDCFKGLDAVIAETLIDMQ